MKYVLGIDGGGTKTHVVLYNIEAGEIESLYFGPTNHELLAGGLNELRVTLGEITSDLFSQKRVSHADIKHSVWGLSGLDTKSQYKVISGFLSEIGFERFSLCNDCDLGIKAMLPEGHGICLVNGTGYNVVGINEKGERYHIGAHFELTGDFGGGQVLGQNAVKTTYMNLFRYRRETILSNIMMKLYEIDSRHDFMDRVCDWSSSGKLPIPGLARCIFDAAAQGDEESLEMLEKMTNEYALCVKSLLEELPFAGGIVNTVLIGSLFTKGFSDIHLRVMEKIKKLIPEKEFNAHLLNRPPVAGALAWALEQSGEKAPWETAMACFSEKT